MAAMTGGVSGEGRFAIMRVARLKTWGQIAAAEDHNARLSPCPNADPNGPPIQLLYGELEIAQAVRDGLKKFGVVPGENVSAKDNPVLAIEMLLTASPEWFEGVDQEEYSKRVVQWLLRTLSYLHKRFPNGECVSVIMHLDESTPHIHAIAVPVVFKADKRRKDKTPEWRLSAKHHIGGMGQMAYEQSAYARMMADIGLVRGKVRSGARHVTNKEHTEKLDAAIADAKRARVDLVDARVEFEREKASMLAEIAELREAAVDDRNAAAMHEGAAVDVRMAAGAMMLQAQRDRDGAARERSVLDSDRAVLDARRVEDDARVAKALQEAQEATAAALASKAQYDAETARAAAERASLEDGKAEARRVRDKYRQRLDATADLRALGRALSDQIGATDLKARTPDQSALVAASIRFEAEARRVERAAGGAMGRDMAAGLDASWKALKNARGL